MFFKKAGNFGAKMRTHTIRGGAHCVASSNKENNELNKKLSKGNVYSSYSEGLSVLKMQNSELNSPMIPQRLLAQQQQCSPGIDQLIQKAGEKTLENCTNYAF